MSATAAQAPEPHIRIRDEIRIALAMSGGIALTIYEAGVAHELWRASTALDDQPEATTRIREAFGNTYRTLLEQVDGGLVVDILTGASAGGINSVVLGSALATGGDFSRLHDLWLEAADLQRLRHPGTPSGSLLSNRILQTSVRDNLEHNLRGMERGTWRRRMRGRDLIVVVTRTNLQGRRRIITDALGHRAVVVTKEDPITFTADDFCSLDRLDDLSRAAAATSAFPVVFPPVQMDGVYYADGGLLDNQPVGHAIKAIRDKKASYRTRRFIVFVEPNPELLSPPPSRATPGGPSVGEVALQVPLMGIKGNIWNAVVELEDYSRRLDHYNHVEPLMALKDGAEVPEGIRFDELFLAHDPPRYARWRSVADLAFQKDTREQRDWMRRVITAAGNMDVYLRWLRALIGQINEVIVKHPEVLRGAPPLIRTPQMPPEQRSDKDALYDLLARLDQALYPAGGPAADRSPYKFGQAIARWQKPLQRQDRAALKAELDLFVTAVGEWTSKPGLHRTGGALPDPDHPTEVPIQVAEAIELEVGQRFLASPAFQVVCWRACVGAEGSPLPLPQEPQALGRRLLELFKAYDRKAYAMDGPTDLQYKLSAAFVRISPNDARNLELIGDLDPGEDESLAEIKLSGELFGHMGGFLDESWRRNDYIWGRLDAAQVLLDLMVTVYGEKHPHLYDERASHLKKLQAEILAEEYYWYTHPRDPQVRREPLPEPGADAAKAKDNRRWIGRGRQTIADLPGARVRETLQYLVSTSLALARGNPAIPTWVLDSASRALRAMGVILKPAAWLVPQPAGESRRQHIPVWKPVLVALGLFGAGLLVGRYGLEGVASILTTVVVVAAAAIALVVLGAVLGWHLSLVVPAAVAAGLVLGMSAGRVWLDWLNMRWGLAPGLGLLATSVLLLLAPFVLWRRRPE